MNTNFSEVSNSLHPFPTEETTPAMSVLSDLNSEGKGGGSC